MSKIKSNVSCTGTCTAPYTAPYLHSTLDITLYSATAPWTTCNSTLTSTWQHPGQHPAQHVSWWRNKTHKTHEGAKDQFRKPSHETELIHWHQVSHGSFHQDADMSCCQSICAYMNTQTYSDEAERSQFWDAEIKRRPPQILRENPSKMVQKKNVHHWKPFF